MRGAQVVRGHGDGRARGDGLLLRGDKLLPLGRRRRRGVCVKVLVQGVDLGEHGLEEAADLNALRERDADLLARLELVHDCGHVLVRHGQRRRQVRVRQTGQARVYHAMHQRYQILEARALPLRGRQREQRGHRLEQHRRVGASGSESEKK